MFGARGRVTIGHLLLTIFVLGVVLASVVMYSAFLSYRIGVVRDMALHDGQRISHLVFENLYSVMRKGSNKAELDDLVHHIQNRLPDYQVTIFRGDPVVRQYGDRAGQAVLRERDTVLQAVFATGKDYAGVDEKNLRYLFPIKVTGECVGCHSLAKTGDVNGVIAVSVPLAVLETPIAQMAYPLMYWGLGLVLALLWVTYLVLRNRVSHPIEDLSEHVSSMVRSPDYAKSVMVGREWPKELKSLAVNFNGLMKQVRDSHQRLHEISIRDPLTGLFNRRHFDDAVDRAIADAQKGGLSFALLLIDLDRFKPINDEFGHAAGDAMLVSVAKSLMSSVRETDVAARVGGDEFAVLAFTSNYAEAQELAERLRVAIESPQLRFGHQIAHPACSIGVAEYPEGGIRAVDLLHAADLAMYVDKQARHGGARDDAKTDWMSR